MLQHYCAWRCTLFWLILHIQIQYGPLSLHVANTFCICSPLAGHILLSGSFWCLLPGLELLQVVPLFLLSNYLTTICWWWLCLHEASLGSLDTGHAMLCFPLFLFHWFHLGLLIFFQVNCLVGISGVRRLLPYMPRFIENGVSQFMNVYESLIFDIARTTSWILCSLDPCLGYGSFQKCG